jgi:hypothetical protein
MKNYIFIISFMIIAGCNTADVPPASPPSESHVNPMEGMLKRDQELRQRFAKIAKGMTESEIKSIMGSPPHEIIREATWVYKLSPASDSMTERHWELLVRFSDGKVQDFQDTYTCYYIEINE